MINPFLIAGLVFTALGLLDHANENKETPAPKPKKIKAEKPKKAAKVEPKIEPKVEPKPAIKPAIEKPSDG